jgi:NAD(P)-dependent dehydrogenase (short-subunit alcohol dehydrogenase family)
MGARLAGKRALAVGCGQGFGATTARALAAEGARVAVADVDGEKAEQVAAEIREAGGDAIGCWVDVGEEAAVRAFVEDAAGRLGGVDVVFNNAAILGTPEVRDDVLRPVLELSSDVWELIMRVNLRGPWLVCKHALPHLLDAGGGSIVNTASLAATATMLTSGAYSVSKGGVNTLSLVLATQYGRQGIRCNAINPGMIETRHLLPEYAPVVARHNLVPRIGRGEDIAALVVFLASDESGYITGQCLSIDGGFASHAPTYADWEQHQTRRLTETQAEPTAASPSAAPD